MDTTPKDNRKVKKPKMEDESKYLPELLAEKDSLDASFTHAMKLLNEGKLQQFDPIKPSTTFQTY